MVLIRDDIHHYGRNDLAMFNMLRSPVWVFDIDEQAMYWANTPALRVWNAASLEELLRRDFRSDMSDASLSILLDWKTKLMRNECVNEQWTLYPQGHPTTLDIFCSAIRIENGRIAMLVEAEIVDLKRVVDDSTVRRFEILKHLPIAVSQFTVDGTLIYQNPQALQLFGSSSYKEDKNDADNNENAEVQGTDSDNQNILLQRFVQAELGRTAIEKAREGTDFSAEVQLYTRPLTESNRNICVPLSSQPQRWFNVLLRRTRDPITSEFVILCIARDISDIVRARQQSTQAAMKSEFLDVMAHEIRTPLHQIVGHVDLLENSVLNEEQLESIQQVQSSSSMLMSIINDLLDCSKLEHGQIQLENVPFALEGLINGCIASIKPQAQKKGLTVSHNIHPSCAPHLSSDQNRLRQVLDNLLSNAVKFTEKGSVTLSVAPCLKTDTVSSLSNDCTKEQWLRFDITDTGIGIEAHEQDAVFERYRQANSSVARRFGGTGLGLPICKGFVELMKGTIRLNSVVGRGTTFSFELPFQVVAQPKDDRCLSPKLQPILKVPLAASLKVLVVEDNKVNQKVVRAMLTRLGHTVTIAENGQVALKELHQSQNSFHVVLMDIQMPVMDGIECAKYIRTVLQIGKEELPIVGLTAGLQRSEKEFYENEVGMNACLGKPLPLEALRNALTPFRPIYDDDNSNLGLSMGMSNQQNVSCC